VAIPAFTQAVETDTSGRAFEWLAYCHARAGNFPTAIEYGGKALAAGRKTVAVYANRAASRSSTGDSAGSLADAEDALKIDPSCKSALVSRAIARVRLQPQNQPLPPEVVYDLEAGLEVDERRGWVLSLLAEARVRVADPTDADRERALWAVNRAVRVGYSPVALEKRKVFAAQLDPERFKAALFVLDTERLPQETRPLCVCPDG